ncbi:MAG: agmatinase [Desulfurococcales archaeon]|nr:agmatinase [Desulfurococcales archaeon]
MSLRELYTIQNPLAFSGTQRPYSEAEVVIVGVPFDSTSSFKPGSRFGPRSVREASNNIESNGILANRSYIEQVKIHDTGDLSVVPGDTLETLNRLSKVSEEVIQDGKLLVAIGGEHTITYGTVKAMTNLGIKPCIIVIDAHFDLRKDYLGYLYSHASVMRRIIESSLSDRIIYIGVRAYEEEEILYAEAHKDRILYKTPIDVEREGYKNITVAAKRFLSQCRYIYVSIDIDGIDPSYAPGTGTPEPFGLSPLTVVKILGGILDNRLVGIDLVEVNPLVDCNDITSVLGAKILQEAILLYKFSSRVKKQSQR